MTLISALHLTYAGFTFGQLGLQLENGLVEIFLSMCGTLVLASCGRASGASKRAAWLWWCCWPSGARGLLHHNHLVCTQTLA